MNTFNFTVHALNSMNSNQCADRTVNPTVPIENGCPPNPSKGGDFMNIFANYNKILTTEEQTAINTAKNNALCNNKYPQPENGIYIAQVDDLKIVPRKDTGAPCFYLRMKLVQGMDAKTKAFMEIWPGTGCPKIFRTLSLSGTKNDAKCIGSAIALASKLHDETEILFNGDFDQLALDIAALRKKIDASYFYLIEYNREDFNHIVVLKILKSNTDEAEAVPPETVPEQPEPEPVPQFDSNGYLPVDGVYPSQGIQKPTSYPMPSYNPDDFGEGDGNEEILFVPNVDDKELPF